MHKIPGYTQITTLLKLVSKRVFSVGQEHWQEEGGHIDLLASAMIEKLEKLNFQAVWDLYKETDGIGEKPLQLPIILSEVISDMIKSLTITDETLQYFRRGYSRQGNDLNDELLLLHLTGIFVEAIIDIISVRYLQYRGGFSSGKARGLICGNMRGGSGVSILTIPSTIILSNPDKSPDFLVEELKRVSKLQKRACPFYNSSLRDNWLDRIFSRADTIDFTKI